MSDYFVPVLPSANIERDVKFYVDGLGFDQVFADEMYALLRRQDLELHLQWHADTDDDPLLGGSVIRIISADVDAWYATVVERKIITPNHEPKQTAWGTYEFGFFDLNKNAVFIAKKNQPSS
jgi:catechol 2,3-dioxygenase-like lactoylglutathione lyase family enzyme